MTPLIAGEKIPGDSDRSFVVDAETVDQGLDNQRNYALANQQGFTFKE